MGLGSCLRKKFPAVNFSFWDQSGSVNGQKSDDPPLKILGGAGERMKIARYEGQWDVSPSKGVHGVMRGL